jgi:hypothetical protein
VTCSTRKAGPDGDLGLALTRDGHGARVVPTLLRYRGAAMAEFLRLLHTLEALQAKAPAGTVLDEAPEPTPPPTPNPDEPERRANADDSAPAAAGRAPLSPPQGPSRARQAPWPASGRGGPPGAADSA